GDPRRSAAASAVRSGRAHAVDRARLPLRGGGSRGRRRGVRGAGRVKSAGRAERVRRRAPFARRGERLAPALSGILLAISFPPFELLVPPFVALVPFLLFVEDRAPGREGRWSAARGGFVLGGVYFGLLLYWLVIALIHYSLLAIPAYVLTVLVLAGFTGSFGAALHYVRERVPVVPL